MSGIVPPITGAKLGDKGLAELRSFPPDERAALVADLKDNAVAQALTDHLAHPRLGRLLGAIRSGDSRPESAAREFTAYDRPAARQAIATLLERAAHPPGAAFYRGPLIERAARALATDALLDAGAANWEPSGSARFRYTPKDGAHARAVVRYGLRLCVECGSEYPSRYSPQGRESSPGYYCAGCAEHVTNSTHAALRDGMHDVLDRQSRALGLT